MRVIVVGAGILGASAAYHLASAGAEVVIVDSAAQGQATAAGAGIVCPWATEEVDPDWYRLAALGARHYPELVRQLAEEGYADTGYRRVGALVAPEAALDLDRLEALMKSRRLLAPEMGAIDRLTPRQARDQFPVLRDETGALRISGGARVDGRRLAAALSGAAVRRGAVARQGTAEILVEGDRVRGVRLGSEAIDGDRLVLAAGAWANQFLGPIGIRLSVEPQRGQIVHLHLPGIATDTWPVLLPLNSYYLLTFEGSHVVVGATRETGAGFDYRVTAAGLAEVLAAGLAIAPGLRSATLMETRIGFRPKGGDAKPLIGNWPGVEGLIIGNGLGHTGLTTGPYAGLLLASLALGIAPDLDLAAFDPGRPG